MSKIKFKIGTSQHVVFNLPSRAVGDSNTCIGKVLVNVSGLNCSNSLSFDREDLIKLYKNASKLYKSLKGQASISSKCKTFNLVVTGTAKGHIKIEVNMSNFQYTSPENSEWQTKLFFYDYSDSLIELVKSKNEIKS